MEISRSLTITIVPALETFFHLVRLPCPTSALYIYNIYMFHLWLLSHRSLIFSNKRQRGRVNKKGRGDEMDIGGVRRGKKYKFDEKCIYFQYKKK